MTQKHHKKSFRRRCWEHRWNLGGLAALLVAITPIYQTWQGARQAPANTDELISRKVDIEDIYYRLQTLTERVDKIETNKMKGN